MKNKHIKSKIKNKGDVEMAKEQEEKVVEQPKEETQVETKPETQETEVPKQEEQTTNEENAIQTNAKEEETQNEDVKEEETQNETAVVETTEQGNGININDLVTKDMLAERLSALEAKLDAVFKENQDLKEELSKAKEETNGLKDKYENKDFGGNSRQGVQTKNNSANETFEEYAKRFL